MHIFCSWSAGAERGTGDACSRLIRANALEAAEDATLTALFPGEMGSEEKKGGMKMFPADTCRAYLTFIHQQSPLWVNASREPSWQVWP